MNRLGYKLGAAFSSGAIALLTFVPGVFAADLEITGNGDGSTNAIVVSSSSNCIVNQTANTNVGAVVGALASTGGNTANSNTGGTTSITTGPATATAAVSVTGGANEATDPCCCTPAAEPQTAEISGNGANTNNAVVSTETKSSTLRQKARTRVRALVGAKAKTGKNNASSNTGTGTTIETGESSADSGLTVDGGVNSLN